MMLLVCVDIKKRRWEWRDPTDTHALDKQCLVKRVMAKLWTEVIDWQRWNELYALDYHPFFIQLSLIKLMGPRPSDLI